MSRGAIRTETVGRSAGGEAPRGQWLTATAFVLAVGLVVARVTMLETVRDPFGVTLGAQPIPRGAGAAAGLVLDALCWVPAILVLVRRVIDPGYRLRIAWSQLWAVLLAATAVASTAWASDRFAAAVAAFHLLSAVVLCFAAAQVVRTWARLRLVAAVCFGLLLVFVAHGAYYRFVDLPDLQLSWQKNKASILQERGWEEGSFAARQFANKIEGGEMMGFSASPNSFAAVIALTCVVSMGVMIQRLVDRDGAAWALAYGAGIGAGAGVIYYTHSRGGLATLVLAAGVLGVLWLMPHVRRALGRHSRAAYAAGVAAALLGIAAVAGHGLYHGSLPSDSLNFRWRYWVGAAGVFEANPLLGVGWGNFGSHYLATRLQAAAEEVKDPHNLLLRFALELGVVGGVLAVGWLLWLWWDLTRPVLPAADDSPLRLWVERARSTPIKRIALIAAVGLAINTIASVDFGEIPDYVIVELFKRGLYFCVLVIGMALVGMKHLEQEEPDGRFAGWVVHSILLGLGLFLAHSMIDVAFFEVGPMFLFFLLAGSALGMRLRENAEKPRKSALAAAGLGGVGLAWLAAVVALVVPVVRGESLAQAGDEEMRQRRPARALREYEAASEVLPVNAEYGFRAAKAAVAAGEVDRAEHWLAEAIRKDPVAVEHYLTRAGLELMKGTPDVARVRADYEKALELNPADVAMRVAYADLLAKSGLRDEARRQYAAALEQNEGYDPTEPKRLPAGEIDRIRAAMKGLE